jgi:predicted ATPase
MTRVNAMSNEDRNDVPDRPEGRDRITELRVQGMRALASVRLPLAGLTVLIGDNGTGKSSLFEALELLRNAAKPGDSISEAGMVHDWGQMFRQGAVVLRIGARVEGAGPPLEYSFAVGRQGSSYLIAEERLDVFERTETAEPLHAIQRDLSGCRVLNASSRKLEPQALAPGHLALTSFGVVAQPAIVRALRAFETGRVHVPFDVMPGWLALEQRRGSPLRRPARVGRAAEVERFGANLANCYFSLAQEHPPEVWRRTLERVQAGLGADVAEVRTPSAGRGQIELVVRFRGLPQPIPTSGLSDGQLAYLAFVALAELGKSHGFVAFDEPESHLRPGLLVRVAWLLEELSQSTPVVVATHSDRLLDAVSDPASSVVLCELGHDRAARLCRPDPKALAAWLERYRGLGELRAEGYDRHVFVDPLENR